MEMTVQFYAPATPPQGKEPLGTHWTGGWVGPTVGLPIFEEKGSKVDARDMSDDGSFPP
jgi:hypothetical protein